MKEDKHIRLIERGHVLHEEREYVRALPYFEKALAISPNCPVALYDQANTLHMLGGYEHAHDILLGLVDTAESRLRLDCPSMDSTPRSICLDAFNLLFLCSLYGKESWHQSIPYLREHLRRRTRGLRSLWSRAEVVSEADRLRREFAPRARPVKEWALEYPA